MTQRGSVIAYVALGANLGDASEAVLRAMAALDTLRSTRVTQRSALYRSAPVDAAGPDFINAVVQVHSQLSAPELLQQLQAIESAAGRERPYPNAPRTLDLDLLLYGDGHIDSAALTVPHPRMQQRAFVLLPLKELAPAFVSDAALQAVADQNISKMETTS